MRLCDLLARYKTHIHATATAALNDSGVTYDIKEEDILSNIEDYAATNGMYNAEAPQWMTSIEDAKPHLDAISALIVCNVKNSSKYFTPYHERRGIGIPFTAEEPDEDVENTSVAYGAGARRRAALLAYVSNR